MKQIIYILVGSLFSFYLNAQDEKAYFDFWVGEWEVTWNEADGKKGKGLNTISKTLDENVINENFRILEGQSKGFKGTSISVYQPRQKRWKQAWADNQGGYFDFVGETDNGKRIFKTQPIKNGDNEVISRMVFKDIKKDSFVWDWESSVDGGKTWKLNWQINYKRKKSNTNSNYGTLNEKAPKETKQYGKLVGEWECLISSYSGDSLVSQTTANWVFKYVLDGYAIQDFWRNPSVANPNATKKQLFGTNLRIYNPQKQQWQCAWLENGNNTMSGVWHSKANDKGDLELYDDTNNWVITFYNITENSFDWKWDFKQPDGSMKTTTTIKAKKI